PLLDEAGRSQLKWSADRQRFLSRLARGWRRGQGTSRQCRNNPHPKAWRHPLAAFQGPWLFPFPSAGKFSLGWRTRPQRWLKALSGLLPAPGSNSQVGFLYVVIVDQ